MSFYLKKLYQRWKAFSKTPKAQILFKWLRRIFVTAVLLFLIHQFLEIGWQKVLSSLPTNPFFYLLYIPFFFALPISELFIYRILWKIRFRDIWPALLVKKVYNSDVVGYSGEVFLFNWADRSIDKKTFDVMREVKDNNVISSIVSTFFTLLVLLLFFESNPSTFNHWFQKIPNNELWYLLIAVAITGILVYKFRNYLVSLPLKKSSEISSIHFIRHCFVFFIQVLQWHIVLPGVPMYVWFTFMAVQLVMTRLPILPNMDLIFLSISIQLTKAMGAPLAAITAIMTIDTVMGKSMHLLIYSYYQVFSKKSLEVENVNTVPNN